MAGNTIASLNVKLLANIGGFASGMAAAAKPLASFAGSVLSTSLKVGGLVSAITGLVGAGSLTALTAHSMEAIDANAKLSDRLGITTEGLTGLQHAGNLAGVSSEELTGGLDKMMRTLGGAAEDGELASNAFTKLGLKATDLANLPTDEAFKKIAQRISEIQNPAERAAAAVGIFGKSGASLLPLLQSGAEGISAAQQEAQRLGLTFNRIDAAKVEAANDSFTRLQGVVTGVGNQLAIGLAPYIDAAVSKIVEMTSAGGGIGPKVGGAIEWVAKAIASAADYLELLPAGFHGFRAGALEAIAGVLDGIDYLGSGLVKLLNLLPGLKLEWTDTFATLKQGMEQVAQEEAGKFDDAMAKFHRGDNAQAVSKVFADIRANAEKSAEGVAKSAEQMRGAFRDVEQGTENLKKVSEALATLQKDVRQAGMSDAQKKLDDLKSLGATPEQLAQAKKLANQLDAMNEARKKQQDMQQKANSIIESVETPTEKYQQKTAELSELLKAGMLSWDQYGRAVRQARGELEKSAKPQKLEAPDLFRAGSAEAAKLVYQTNRQQQQGKDQLPQKQLLQQQKTNYLLDRIDRNTRPILTDSDTTMDV